MFENVGKKIMGLAQVLCWLGIIGGIITALVLMIEGHFYYYDWIWGLAGAVGAWISSWFMYAFGQLVDDMHTQKENSVNFAAIHNNDKKEKVELSNS